MKQGTGHNTQSGQKREPNSHAVDVCSVAEMGAHQVHIRGTSQELYSGRGFEAPSNGSTTHHHGSQGKHK